MADAEGNDRTTAQELGDYLDEHGVDEISDVLQSVLSAQGTIEDVAIGLYEVIGSRPVAAALVAEIGREAADDDEGKVGNRRDIRLLRAKYRGYVRRAFDRVRGDAHDWKNFEREVYRDVIDDEWLIHSRIVKTNGETLFLATTPDSLVRLMRQFARSLAYAPTSELDQEDVSELLELVKGFRDNTDPDDGDDLLLEG